MVCYEVHIGLWWVCSTGAGVWDDTIRVEEECYCAHTQTEETRYLRGWFPRHSIGVCSVQSQVQLSTTKNDAGDGANSFWSCECWLNVSLPTYVGRHRQPPQMMILWLTVKVTVLLLYRVRVCLFVMGNHAKALLKSILRETKWQCNSRHTVSYPLTKKRFKSESSQEILAKDEAQ